MEEPEKDFKWILVISVILFFLVRTNSIAIRFTPRHLSIWGYLSLATSSFFLATIISTSLYMVGFWKRPWTYKLSVLFFIISMALLLILNLNWLVTLYY